MNKAEVLRKVRDVMTGVSCYTHCAVWKEKRSWNIDYSTDRLELFDGGIVFEHCCNEISLRELKQEFRDKWRYRDFEDRFPIYHEY